MSGCRKGVEKRMRWREGTKVHMYYWSHPTRGKIEGKSKTDGEETPKAREKMSTTGSRMQQRKELRGD